MISQNCHLILASSSIARKNIMSNLGLKFEIINPEFDEESAKPKIKNLSIKDQALYLAKQKALSISVKYPYALFIGSDQICELENTAIDKSKNKNDAVFQLKTLSRKTHIQNNASCLYQEKNLLFTNISLAKLSMRDLTDNNIKNYVDTDKSWGCAGSYKFESLGKHLFSKVEGADNAIIGMDILPLLNFLHEQNYITL
jgi:septum formation protein